MKDNLVYKLADIATLAQTEIQKDFSKVCPVISISHHLRKLGFASDSMTIQNADKDKRILIVLHDDKPEEVLYEFGKVSEDPQMKFSSIPLKEVDVKTFYNWMKAEIV